MHPDKNTESASRERVRYPHLRSQARRFLPCVASTSEPSATTHAGRDGSCTHATSDDVALKKRQKALEFCLVGGLTVLALLFRVYRLDSQSAWCDETSPGWFDYSDLATQIQMLHFKAPDNVPLFYIAMYFWTKAFGLSIASVRMLTVAAGVACIPLIYAIARRTFGVRAGFIAASCATLSPFLVWQAQTIRPHGLCVPVVLLGVYALLRAPGGRRGWWVVAFACNLALIWTQEFMVFLLPVQALYLLCSPPNGFRKALYWSLAQVLTVIPPFLWMLPYLRNVPEAEFDHFTLPGLWRIIVDLVGDDVTRFSSEFPIGKPAWTEALSRPDAWESVGGVLLITVLGILAICSTYRMVSETRKGNAKPAFLFGVAVFPVMTLVCLSYFWRPCVEVRHTPYCVLALYAIAGWTISSIPRRAPRYFLVAALLGLLGFQLAFYLPAGLRTNWSGAAKEISARQSKDDIILVKGIIPYARDTFMINQSSHSIPVIQAHTIEAVCDKTRAFFGPYAHPQRRGCVWAVIEMAFFSPDGLQACFKEQFAGFGIDASYVFYPGMQGLLLCRFFQGGAPAQPSSAPAGPPSFTDYEALLSDLRMPEVDRQRTLTALRRVIDIPIPLGKNSYFTLSYLLSEEHEYDLAEICAKRAIEQLPTYGDAHFALGLALAGKGDVKTARETFARSFALNGSIARLYGTLISALYDSPSESSVQRELVRLAGSGFPYPVLRRLAAVQFPHLLGVDPGMAARDPLYSAACAGTP